MGTKFNEYIRTLGGASPKAKEIILYWAAHDPEISLFDLTVLVSRAYPNDTLLTQPKEDDNA